MTSPPSLPFVENGMIWDGVTEYADFTFRLGVGNYFSAPHGWEWFTPIYWNPRNSFPNGSTSSACPPKQMLGNPSA